MKESCFDIALSEASNSLQKGSFPVGAVLVIDGVIIGQCGNTVGETKTRFEHAETMLIQKYAKEVYDATVRNAQIELYSTVEPCLQCLGVAVMNRVTHIWYLMPDPHGGACKLDRMTLGRRFHKIWPNIEQVEYRIQDQRDMVEKYIAFEAARGNLELASRLTGVLN